MEIVAFEGINRSGKSTQLRRAYVALQEVGVRVAALKFPARQTPIGQLICEFFTGRCDLDPLVLQYLLEANKLELQAEIKRLADGGHEMLLIDRYLLSGVAYGIARGIPFEQIKALQAPLTKPTFTFLFDLPADEALARSQAVTERDEQDVEQLHKVRRLFQKYAYDRYAPADVIIDARTDPDTIHDHIMSCLIGRLLLARSKLQSNI